jgi:DNA-binding MarR family transcriptional regulator
VQEFAPGIELDDDVTALTSAVLTASRLLVAVSAKSLAAAQERVTLPQFRMLVLLSTHGETNLVTLAERLVVNPSTALRMVDRLVDGGFVGRRVNPESRRETLLQLTGAGQQIVDEVTSRRRQEIAAIVVRMSPTDRIDLVTALRAFASAGGEFSAEERERDLVPLGWELAQHADLCSWSHPGLAVEFGRADPECYRIG